MSAYDNRASPLYPPTPYEAHTKQMRSAYNTRSGNRRQTPVNLRGRLLPVSARIRGLYLNPVTPATFVGQNTLVREGPRLKRDKTVDKNGWRDSTLGRQRSQSLPRPTSMQNTSEQDRSSAFQKRPIIHSGKSYDSTSQTLHNNPHGDNGHAAQSRYLRSLTNAKAQALHHAASEILNAGDAKVTGSNCHMPQHRLQINTIDPERTPSNGHGKPATAISRGSVSKSSQSLHSRLIPTVLVPVRRRTICNTNLTSNSEKCCAALPAPSSSDARSKKTSIAACASNAESHSRGNDKPVTACGGKSSLPAVGMAVGASTPPQDANTRVDESSHRDFVSHPLAGTAYEHFLHLLNSNDYGHMRDNKYVINATSVIWLQAVAQAWETASLDFHNSFYLNEALQETVRKCRQCDFTVSEIRALAISQKLTTRVRLALFPWVFGVSGKTRKKYLRQRNRNMPTEMSEMYTQQQERNVVHVSREDDEQSASLCQVSRAASIGKLSHSMGPQFNISIDRPDPIVCARFQINSKDRRVSSESFAKMENIVPGCSPLMEARASMPMIASDFVEVDNTMFRSGVAKSALQAKKDSDHKEFSRLVGIFDEDMQKKLESAASMTNSKRSRCDQASDSEQQSFCTTMPVELVRHESKIMKSMCSDSKRTIFIPHHTSTSTAVKFTKPQQALSSPTYRLSKEQAQSTGLCKRQKIEKGKGRASSDAPFLDAATQAHIELISGVREQHEPHSGAMTDAPTLSNDLFFGKKRKKAIPHELADFQLHPLSDETSIGANENREMNHCNRKRKMKQSGRGSSQQSQKEAKGKEINENLVTSQHRMSSSHATSLAAYLAPDLANPAPALNWLLESPATTTELQDPQRMHMLAKIRMKETQSTPGQQLSRINTIVKASHNERGHFRSLTTKKSLESRSRLCPVPCPPPTERLPFPKLLTVLSDRNDCINACTCTCDNHVPRNAYDSGYSSSPPPTPQSYFQGMHPDRLAIYHFSRDE